MSLHMRRRESVDEEMISRCGPCTDQHLDFRLGVRNHGIRTRDSWRHPPRVQSLIAGTVA